MKKSRMKRTLVRIKLWLWGKIKTPIESLFLVPNISFIYITLALTAAKFSNSFYVDKEIKITTEDYLLVNANFPLYYKVANESEKQKIQQLGFHCKAEICHKNLDLLGDIYDLKSSKVKIHRPSTQLTRPLPFTFKQKTKKYGDKKVSAKVEEVVAATVLTPFALALDVITLPIQVFFAADFALSNPE